MSERQEAKHTSVAFSGFRVTSGIYSVSLAGSAHRLQSTDFISSNLCLVLLCAGRAAESLLSEDPQ